MSLLRSHTSNYWMNSQHSVVSCALQGWPSILFFWGCLSFVLLYGDNRFVRHWLFYQTKIEMCSEKNPAGDVLSRAPYLGVLVASMFVGVVVTIKRYWVAHHLARRLHCKLLWLIASLFLCFHFLLTQSTLRSSLQRKCSQFNGKTFALDGSELPDPIAKTTGTTSLEAGLAHHQQRRGNPSANYVGLHAN